MFRCALNTGRVASKAAFMFTRCSAMSTRYTVSHEFVMMEGDIGTVGITQFAADALGDVVFVDLPSIGNKYVAGDSFGSVESVKAASDVYSPVAGEVVEVNVVSVLFYEIFMLVYKSWRIRYLIPRRMNEEHSNEVESLYDLVLNLHQQLALSVPNVCIESIANCINKSEHFLWL